MQVTHRLSAQHHLLTFVDLRCRTPTRSVLCWFHSLFQTSFIPVDIIPTVPETDSTAILYIYICPAPRETTPITTKLAKSVSFTVQFRWFGISGAAERACYTCKRVSNLYTIITYEDSVTVYTRCASTSLSSDSDSIFSRRVEDRDSERLCLFFRRREFSAFSLSDDLPESIRSAPKQLTQLQSIPRQRIPLTSDRMMAMSDARKAICLPHR